ncbi:MAG: hypothetical protein ACRCUI_10835 [Polymorphobacter sp.]
MLGYLMLLLAADVPMLNPQDIAKESAKDLQPGQYYNKPGASRADYDHDWHACRMVARGSDAPGGDQSALIAQQTAMYGLAGGIGGAIGAAIGSAVAEAAQRRVNRRTCLLINGWRIVEVDAETRAKLEAMSEQQRYMQFETAVGDPEPRGRIIRWRNSFAAPRLAPEAAK